MCLITEQKEPFIAQEDMKVYKKLLLPNYRSRSQYFVYIPEQLYKTEIEESQPNRRTYADHLVYLRYDLHHGITGAFEVNPNLIAYGPGYHFSLTEERIRNWGDSLFNFLFTIVTCTVPKGSEYYLDETGLGVANQIIIHKIEENVPNN